MSNQAIKGDAFYLNQNKQKKADNHPDYTGGLKLTVSQLQGLIQIYKRAQENNEEPILQVDVSGWQRKSRDNGQPYVYCKNEVYTGPRRKKAASEDLPWN